MLFLLTLVGAYLLLAAALVAGAIWLANKKGWNRQMWIRGTALVLTIFLFSFLYWWHINPLLSDEEMIARFKAHKPEIEELVASFRSYKHRPGPGKPSWWSHYPEVEALMQKAGVKRVSSGGPYWFPNPYSKEAARQFDEKIRSQKPGDGFSLRSYGSINVELVDEDRGTRHFAWVLLSTGSQLIWKELVYFPEVPRIENGEILRPVSPRPIPKPKERGPLAMLVAPSLDVYPSGWGHPGNCAYRQIESQWFIKMCVAAP